MFEVRTLFVQGDLHSLLCRIELARTRYALPRVLACKLFLFFSAVGLSVVKK
jgi:hypothetical protein